ncbi:hypothetical protein IWX90DRAFT_66602 [Phyllosticta citrichinensis]|uniref:Uncharacterized protein n=1 Tax=Phyllosticta citrichinensis TaxID=1130410 RepID=A0ABR1XHK4_9PEZI
MCRLFLGAWEWIGLGLLGVADWCLLRAVPLSCWGRAQCPDGISAQNKRFPCPTLRLTLIQSAAQTTTSSSVSPPRPPAPSHGLFFVRSLVVRSSLESGVQSAGAPLCLMLTARCLDSTTGWLAGWQQGGLRTSPSLHPDPAPAPALSPGAAKPVLRNVLTS